MKSHGIRARLAALLAAGVLLSGSGVSVSAAANDADLLAGKLSELQEKYQAVTGSALTIRQTNSNPGTSGTPGGANGGGAGGGNTDNGTSGGNSGATTVEQPALIVNGASYRLGMARETLIAAAGLPDEVLPTCSGYDWYVFGTSNYSKSFFMAGVANATVVALAASGASFVYGGMRAGDVPASVSRDRSVRLLTDENDGGILHGICLTDLSQQSGGNRLAAALAGEAKAIFHLTNGFRAMHGRSALRWDSAAAEAARLHSQDMADNDYFSHESRDGRVLEDRLRAANVAGFAAWGENIGCGTYGSYAVFDALDCYDGWVNSAGHRNNLLQSAYTRLGVGSGYNAGVSTMLYYTQDFCG